MEDIYFDFWQAFLEETGTPENTYMDRCTYFGNSEEASIEVLEQLLRGEKTALSHCVSQYIVKKQRMPRLGDYIMVTDFYGNPCCILKTVGVTIEPLPQLPEELILRETPGITPAAWLAEKQAEFAERAKKGGFHYHPELPVLMETVEVVYPVK